MSTQKPVILIVDDDPSDGRNLQRGVGKKEPRSSSAPLRTFAKAICSELTWSWSTTNSTPGWK